MVTFVYNSLYEALLNIEVLLPVLAMKRGSVHTHAQIIQTWPTMRISTTTSGASNTLCPIYLLAVRKGNFSQMQTPLCYLARKFGPLRITGSISKGYHADRRRTCAPNNRWTPLPHQALFRQVRWSRLPHGGVDHGRGEGPGGALGRRP